METLIESHAVATPLGIRFWDPAQGREVVDHLEVTAMRVGGSGRASRATRTQSQVFVFHRLEGFAFPVLPEEDGPGPDAVEFLIDVRDRLARFHDTRFRVPAPHRGLWQPIMGGSPLVRGSGAFLLSAPTRPTPPGAARVSADLWDIENDLPASFALLEVRIKGRLWYGMADHEGRCVVLFPYPTPETVPGSPAPPQSLTQYSWAVEVSAFYDPNLGLQTAAEEPAEQDLVRSQPPARIQPGPTNSPPDDSTTLPFTVDTMLDFGSDLILRSGSESRLFITPVTSP